MKNLIFRFKVWRLMGYPLAPKWYKNLSVHWSKREQELQRSMARVHQGFRDNTIKATDKVDWGVETDSGEIKYINF